MHPEITDTQVPPAIDSMETLPVRGDDKIFSLLVIN